MHICLARGSRRKEFPGSAPGKTGLLTDRLEQTTKLYDRRNDEITLDEIERILI